MFEIGNPDTAPPALVTVGSSDVASILGLSPWSSQWATWARLMGHVERYNQVDTPSQARGRILEPAIAAWYAEIEGLNLKPGPAIGRDPIIGRENWIHARPDFFAWPPRRKRQTRLIEVKTTRAFDPDDGWGESGTDQAPPYYLIQCVWQSIATGIGRIDLVAFCPMTDEIRIYVIEPSESLRANVLATVRAWRDRHVVGGEPPSIDGSASCSAALGERFRNPGPARREATAEDVEAVNAYRLASRAAKIATTAKEEAANRLKLAIGDARGLSVGGDKLADWSTVKPSRRVDSKRLASEYPEVYESVTTLGEPSRRLSLAGDSSNAE